MPSSERTHSDAGLIDARPARRLSVGSSLIPAREIPPTRRCEAYPEGSLIPSLGAHGLLHQRRHAHRRVSRGMPLNYYRSPWRLDPLACKGASCRNHEAFEPGKRRYVGLYASISQSVPWSKLRLTKGRRQQEQGDLQRVHLASGRKARPSEWRPQMNRRLLLASIATLSASRVVAQSTSPPAPAPSAMTDAREKHIRDTTAFGSLSLLLS